MLMGTQLINPTYFTQGIIWPSSALLLFSSPYCPQIQPVLSIHLKGGYKSRLKKNQKEQDSSVLLPQTGLCCSLLPQLSLTSPLQSPSTAPSPHGLSHGMGPALPPAQQGTMVMISHRQSKAHSHRQQCTVHPPSRECTENTTRAWLHLVCSCWHLQKCFCTKTGTY